MPTLYLATKNLHKVQEIQAILGNLWSVSPCQELSNDITWNETASTFRGNALIKAQALLTHTDQCVLADDSGLEVEVLNGSPGVYSARYAGPEATDAENLRKLLKVLRGMPPEQRKARFVCVLCYIDANREVHYFEGYCPGTLLSEPRGSEGFGYDPIFVPDGFEASFAELKAEEKNQLSHRSKAMAQFLDHLKDER